MKNLTRKTYKLFFNIKHKKVKKVKVNNCKNVCKVEAIGNMVIFC